MTTDHRRRLSALFAAAFGVAVLAPSASRADGPASDPPAAGSAADADPGDTFEHGMEQSGKAWKALRQSSFDAASRDADLRHVQDLQAGLLTAKSVADRMPMMGPAEKKYGTDEAAYHRDLRAGLIKTLEAALKLEAAVDAGDADAAKAAFKALAEGQREGHASFRPGRDNMGAPGRR